VRQRLSAIYSRLMLCCVLTLFIGIGGPLLGQGTTGTITGQLLSADGAGIPNAAVVIRNQATNTSRQVMTSADGTYEAGALNPGTYTVSAEPQGFAPVKNTDVALASQRTIRIDLHLVIGGSTAEVTVVSGSPVIQTDMPSIASTVTADNLTNTSSNLLSTSDATGDSGLFSYITLLPGGYQTSGFRYSLGGSRGSEAYYNVDGISSNSVLYGNFVGTSEPSFDMIQEVEYDAVNNKAELGQLLNVTTITKSGGNRFHGSLFEHNSNTSLTARNYFAVKKGNSVSNDFGGSIGGPILHDKLFFFGAYEGLRQSIPITINPTVPTLAMRGGDFSSLLQGATPIVIKNPLTGVAFANNVIPNSSLSSAALAWQNLFYPLPNSGAVTSYANNFIGTYPQKTSTNRYDGRVDYTISKTNSIFSHFSYIQSAPQVLDSGLPPELTGYRVQHRKTEQGVISDSWTLTPNMINIAKVGFMHTRNNYGGSLDGQTIISQLGIQGFPAAPADATGIPNVYINGFTSPFQLPASEPTEQTIQFIDNLTYQCGSHTLKAGVEYRPQQGEQYFNPSFGSFAFDGSLSNFGYSDFLLGLPQSTAYTYTRTPEYARLWFLSGFLQDDWKVKPNLTVFYGARYDYDSPAVDKNDAVASFNPASGAIVVPNASVAQKYINPLFPSVIPITTAAQAGFPSRSLRNSFKTAIYPRVGFSWRPFKNDDTVIRGGYGLFNDDLTADLFYNLYGGPFGLSTGYTNTIKNGTPLVTFTQPINAAAGGVGAVVASSLDVNLRNPYVQQVNLTVEQNIGFHTGVRFSYVGTFARKLIYERDLNQVAASTAAFSQANTPYPLYQNAYQFLNGGVQNYNAFTTELNHPIRNGLTFEAAITWAKNMTDVNETGDVEGGVPAENSSNLLRQYGNAQYSPRINFVSNVIYDLPIGPGKWLLNSNGLLGRTVGGWRVSGAYIAQTGQFLTPLYAGVDASNTNQFSGTASIVPGAASMPSGGRSFINWFNPAAYKIPTAGTFGNAAFGSIVGPSLNDVNLALFKIFDLSHHTKLQVEGSFTNVLNHTNFGTPDMTVTDSGAGRITSTTGTAFGGPRAGLLTARIEF
jgi:hypothetical protein